MNKSGIVEEHMSQVEGDFGEEVTHISKRSWFKGGPILMALGLVVLLGTAIGAANQSLRPDPFQSFDPWTDADWWLYPQEMNGFRRLASLPTDLNSFAVDTDGQSLWAVGDGGLIVHSPDNGKTWVQQHPPVPESLESGQQQSVSWWQRLSPVAPVQAESAPIDAGQQRVFDSLIQRQGQRPQQTPFEKKELQMPEVLEIKEVEKRQVVEKKRSLASQTDLDHPLINGALLDVVFIDDQNGWAVGAGGLILGTVDGGQNWRVQDSGTSANLYSVAFIDAQNGWAVGDTGTMLRTTDGGVTWEFGFGGYGDGAFVSVGFVDAQRGWVVSDVGHIFETSDGGENWLQKGQRLEDRYIDAFFLDGQHAWVAGEDGGLQRTSDGGQSWTSITSGMITKYSSVYLLNEKQGWAVGERGTIVSTEDGGESWLIQQSNTEAELRKVYFLDAQRGWAVGTSGAIVTTNDGGRTWTNLSRPHVQWSSLYFLSQEIGWLVGSYGVIRKTIDGGQHWRQQVSGSQSHLHSVHFVDDQRGWVVGDFGTILHTQDAGLSWTIQDSGTNVGLSSVYFQKDGLTGWAVGEMGNRKEGGMVLSTTDGGRTWNTQTEEIGVDASLTLVRFINERFGWMAGNRGRVLKTTNGGESWSFLNTVRRTPYSNLFFVDKDIGWVIGAEGEILSTTDGGQGWQERILSTRSNLNSIQFMDAQNGWLVGDKGEIHSTINGGLDWQRRKSGTSENLRSVFFLDSQFGWASGDQGTLLQTKDGGQTWSNPLAPPGFGVAPWVWFSSLLGFVLLISGFMSTARQQRSEEVRKQAEAKGTRPKTPEAKTSDVFVSDRALDDPNMDALGHKEVAEGLASFMLNENTEPRITLAVSGAWGMGKSSIMGLMKRELEAKGYRPVWYNVWHHQEDPDRVASLFASIRQQAVPPFPSLKWFRFRIEAIWQRGWRMRLLLLGLVALLAFAFSHVFFEEGRQRAYEAWDYWWEKTPSYVLSEAALSPEMIKAGRKPAPPHTLGNAFSNRELENLRNWLQRADCGPNTELRAGQCLFRSKSELVEALPNEWASRLSEEQSEALEYAIQRLPPPDGVKVPALEKILGLGAVFSAFLVFLINSASILGISATSLLQFGRAVTTGAADKPNFRLGARQHYQHLAKVLGRRLVIIIDDLDRCRCETIVDTLEAVNFLVDSGDCFVVLGLAPDYVVNCVGIQFEEHVTGQAQALETSEEEDDHERESLDDLPMDSPQAVFARRYLEKLINIEIPVPKAAPNQMQSMLTKAQEAHETEQKRKDKCGMLSRRWDQLKSLSHMLWPGLLFLVALSIGVFLAVDGAIDKVKRDQVQETLITETTAPAEVYERPVVDEKPVELIEEPKPDVKSASASRPVSIRPGQAPRDDDSLYWLILWLVIPALLLGIWFWLGRNARLSEQVQAMGEALAKQARLQVGGVISEHDSDEFRDALHVWAPVIAANSTNPRSFKRFVNRMRFFAMRLRKNEALMSKVEKPESLLVGLGALDELGELQNRSEALWAFSKSKKFDSPEFGHAFNESGVAELQGDDPLLVWFKDVSECIRIRR